MSAVRIRGIDHDPFGGNGADADGTDSHHYLLIESEVPLGPGEWHGLEAIGIVEHERVEATTYLCTTLEEVDLGLVRSLSFVTNAAPYSKTYKLSLDLPDEPAGRAGAMTPPIPIDVSLHHDVDTEALAAELASRGIPIHDIEVGQNRLRFHAKSYHLDTLVELDAVRHIESTPSYEYCCDQACRLAGVPPVHEHLSLKGRGEIIAFCDSGFDTGDEKDVHPAFAGRVRKLYRLGREESASDITGHGTHVAGVAAGDGTCQTIGSLAGSAPEAELIVQSVFQSPAKPIVIPVDLGQLLQPIYDDGARVHNNSWIERRKPRGKYSNHCEDIDRFVSDHRDLVVVCATGNGGDLGNGDELRNQTIRPPAVAKNCIAVGASENERLNQSVPWGRSPWRSLFRDSQQISDDGWSDNPEGLAVFSGRGPTEHDRIKPDLVAPGTAVLSALSRASAQDDSYGRSPDPGFTFRAGTSVAAPMVAGCAAIVRQHLRGALGKSPSAALVKAVLINGAGHIRGQFQPSESPTLPNFSEGWGRVDLARALAPDPPERVQVFDEGRVLLTDEEAEENLNSLESTTLKVTLVWTDLPGEFLRNDLDLIVKAPDGRTRHGNRPGDQPSNSSDFDRTNNVEQIVWPDFPTGPFKICVQAHATDKLGQSFALVVCGGI